MKSLLNILVISLGIYPSSASDDLFDLVRQKLGGNPAFVAGLEEAQEYVDVVTSKPDRDSTHPIIQTVLDTVYQAVQNKTGEIFPEQTAPTWNTIIFDILRPLNSLQSAIDDPTERVLTDPDYAGHRLRGADPDYTGIESMYMQSKPPFYQCPVLSENIPNGLFGYATMILATAYRVWLSGVILEDFKSPGENRSIMGFLIHDACAHNRTILALTPDLALWIENGNFLEFVKRLVTEASSTEELKANFMFLFYLYHERIGFQMSLDAPHEANLKDTGYREAWQELEPLCVAFSKFLATYGNFFITGEYTNTTLSIDQQNFANWLFSIDRKNAHTTDYYS